MPRCRQRLEDPFAQVDRPRRFRLLGEAEEAPGGIPVRADHHRAAAPPELAVSGDVIIVGMTVQYQQLVTIARWTASRSPSALHDLPDRKQPGCRCGTRVDQHRPAPPNKR